MTKESLDFLCEIPDFSEVYSHVCVPEMLSGLFSNYLHLNLATDTNTMIVDLFIIYVDLLEKVSEETAQEALKIGAEPYFEKVLTYGNRPNLLSQGENNNDEQEKSDHPLI